MAISAVILCSQILIIICNYLLWPLMLVPLLMTIQTNLNQVVVSSILVLMEIRLKPRFLLDPDADGDDLTDHCESIAGTNSGIPDTDGDGLVDGEEDANGNGVVDVGETDPLNPDTDGDGFSDGHEVIAGSDPLDPASVPTIPDGDINGDGQVNTADVLLARRAVLEGSSILTAEQFLRGDVQCNR